MKLYYSDANGMSGTDLVYLIREAGMAGRPPRAPDPAHPRVELTIEETP